MAKRSAEESLLFDSPAKRLHRTLRTSIAALESVSVGVGVCLSPEALLLDSRCKKRPHHRCCYPEQEHEEEEEGEEEEEAGFHRVLTGSDSREMNEVLEPGRFQNHCSSESHIPDKKRPRGGDEGSETVPVETKDVPSQVSDGGTSPEDCAYNSFQYWRTPLPHLDLSLIEELCDHSHTDPRTKDKHSTDAMET